MVDLDPPASEPLSLLESRTGDGARVLEFSCRGDRVVCQLVVPAGAGPFPLALAQLADARVAPRDWLERGLAVALLDLPLHGTRHSPKLSEELLGSIDAAARGEPISETSSLLWSEFTRQGVLELRRVLDVLGGRKEIDARRVGYLGVGVAGLVGSLACAVDPRPAACVLAWAGGGFAPDAIDPIHYLGRIAPRPLLLVERTPGTSAEARAQATLREAAAAPHRVVTHDDPTSLLEAARRFLAEAFAA